MCYTHGPNDYREQNGENFHGRHVSVYDLFGSVPEGTRVREKQGSVDPPEEGTRQKNLFEFQLFGFFQFAVVPEVKLRFC